MLNRLRRGRYVPEPVVLAWRAPREAVRDRLEREAVPAALGPESDGWTLVRVVPDDDGVLDRHDRGVLSLLDDVSRSLGVPGARCIADGKGNGVVLVFGDGPEMVEAELSSVDLDLERAGWGRLLLALGTPERLAAVVEAAVRPAAKPDAALRRAHAVARAAGLPAQLFDGDLDRRDLVEVSLARRAEERTPPADPAGRRRITGPPSPLEGARMPFPFSGVEHGMEDSR